MNLKNKTLKIVKNDRMQTRKEVIKKYFIKKYDGAISKEVLEKLASTRVNQCLK